LAGNFLAGDSILLRHPTAILSQPTTSCPYSILTSSSLFLYRCFSRNRGVTNSQHVIMSPPTAINYLEPTFNVSVPARPDGVFIIRDEEENLSASWCPEPDLEPGIRNRLIKAVCHGSSYYRLGTVRCSTRSRQEKFGFWDTH
jgi:hypothetical protein